MKWWWRIASWMSKNEGIVLALLFIGGFFYRWWFASLAYPYPIYDMDRYVVFAHDILAGHLVADCCEKNAGYPFFLAIIFHLFGENNYMAVRLAQVFLELATIVAVYGVSKNLFGRRGGLTAAALYTVNPFTSSYVGLLLPEILSIFLMSIWLVVIANKKFASSPLSWLVSGAILGLFIFVRKQGLGIGLLGPIVLSLFVTRGTIRRIGFLVVTTLGVLIVSVYSLYAYQAAYQVLSIVPPYNFSGFIYSTFFQTKPHAELLLMGQDFEPIYYQIGTDWHQAPISERINVNKRYHQLFREKLAKEWPLFFRNYARNMFWIWDRDHLFYYLDPWYPSDRSFVRVLNILYFGLFTVGILDYIKNHLSALLRQSIFTMMVLNFLLITFTFTLVSNEVRHSLVFMSFLTLWAGNGVLVSLRVGRAFLSFHNVQSVHGT